MCRPVRVVVHTHLESHDRDDAATVERYAASNDQTIAGRRWFTPRIGPRGQSNK
jgi:hypothetical protein